VLARLSSRCSALLCPQAVPCRPSDLTGLPRDTQRATHITLHSGRVCLSHACGCPFASSAVLSELTASSSLSSSPPQPTPAAAAALWRSCAAQVNPLHGRHTTHRHVSGSGEGMQSGCQTDHTCHAASGVSRQ
jgi:hypothetical protein